MKPREMVQTSLFPFLTGDESRERSAFILGSLSNKNVPHHIIFLKLK